MICGLASDTRLQDFLDANHLQLQFLYLSIYYYFYYLLLLFILFSKCSRDANIESKNHEDAAFALDRQSEGK